MVVGRRAEGCWELAGKKSELVCLWSRDITMNVGLTDCFKGYPMQLIANETVALLYPLLVVL